MIALSCSVLLIGLIAYLLVRGGDERLEEIEERKKQIQWPAAN